MYRKVFTILLVFTALRSSNGLKCGTCHGAEHISKCFSYVECDSQECFLHITDHGNNHKYTAGCGTIAGCSASDTRQSEGSLKRARVQPMCSMCCSTEMCNVINPHCGTLLTTTPYATPAPDSTIKTTYATPPTDDATTTAKATTFAVPNPETTVKTTYATPPIDGSTTTTNAKATTFDVPSPETTVKTTYATPPGGHPLKGVDCEVCDGRLCGIIPGNDPVQACPSTKPYCMNTVVNADTGQKTYTKRCATNHDCQTKWWEESSDETKCTDFNAAIPYFFQFTCSYCCVTTGCNSKIFPDPDTLFQGKS